MGGSMFFTYWCCLAERFAYQALVIIGLRVFSHWCGKAEWLCQPAPVIMGITHTNVARLNTFHTSPRYDEDTKLMCILAGRGYMPFVAIPASWIFEDPQTLM